jgi:anti-sigma B factor antagonist
MSLAFEIAHHGNLATVHLTGKVDREAGTTLDQAFTTAIASGPTTVELDFDRVEYINSTGIALIVGLLARARALGVPIRAAGLTPHSRHVFEITRLSDFVEIVQPVKG